MLLPVSVKMTAQGMVSSTGISFDDFHAMQTSRKIIGHCRRFCQPLWVMNNSAFQKVIVEYVVQRYCGSSKSLRASMPMNLTPMQQLRWAEQGLASRQSSLERQIGSLCARYLEAKRSGADAGRLRQLESSIGSIDMTIIVNRSPAAIACSAVFLYYRVGLDSVGVAQELGLKPPTVRQMLRRVWKAAVACGFDAPAKNPANGYPPTRTRFKDENTGEIIENVSQKKAAIEQENSAAIRNTDDRWSAENLAAFRARKVGRLTVKQDREKLAALRAARAEFISRYKERAHQ